MKRLMLVAVLCFSLGCAAKKPIVGSANQFDSDTYIVLATTDSLIQSTKAALEANSFPPQIVGNVRTALNALITVYNVADKDYRDYHAAAISGTATAAQQAKVASEITSVQSSSATLVTIKGGK